MKGALCLLTLLGLAVLNVYAVETSTPPAALCSQDISDQCPDFNPEVPILLADPENCAKFCECSYGLAFSFTCPAGTLFDPALEVCAQGSSVDCGDRPIDAKFH